MEVLSQEINRKLKGKLQKLRAPEIQAESEKRELQENIKNYFASLSKQQELFEFLKRTGKKIDFLENTSKYSIVIDGYCVGHLALRNGGLEGYFINKGPADDHGDSDSIYEKITDEQAVMYTIKLMDYSETTITPEQIKKEIENELEKILE